MGRRRKKKNFIFKNPKGVTYEVIFRKPNKMHYGKDCDGVCYDPEDEIPPKILINPYLTSQSELNTSIHEFAHAFFWDKSESDVYKFANTLSRFLYNEQKWRKNEKKPVKKRVTRNRKEKPSDNTKNS